MFRQWIGAHAAARTPLAEELVVAFLASLPAARVVAAECADTRQQGVKQARSRMG
jgi:hypothetical protein